MQIRRSSSLKAIVSSQGALQNLSQAQKHLRMAAAWLEGDISVDQDVAARNRQLEVIDLIAEAYQYLVEAMVCLSPTDI